MFNQLLKCKNKKSIIQITRRLNNEQIAGIVLGLSNNLVLFKILYDFHYNGYIVFSIKDILRIRSGVYEKYLTKILKLEHINTVIDDNLRSINLENWKSTLESISLFKKCVIIEEESNEGGSFFIGKITKMTNDYLLMKTFDGLGFWNDHSSRIKYSLISVLTFDDEYSKTVSKYVRKRKKEKGKKVE